VQFGEYELDVRGGELRKQGIRVQLQEQPFQILKILLERPGQVVTQEELRKKIWPSDTFVDFDHGINNAIKRLRVALSDSAEKPRYIETLARHGYRFIASINARQIESVAVLPLDNLSGDPEQEYFAEGLTEALINTLAKIGALRVISRTSVMHYKQAIAKDPAYAAAYAGLADCLTALSAWGLVPASEGCDKARQLAQRAVEMDHSLAEAHTALAYATIYDYDFLTAVKEFERAIELNPRYATAHQLFGFCLGVMGRYEEAYTELQRALRLDPLSSIINAFVGWVYLYGRRYDQAIEQFRKTLELDPSSGPAQAGLGWAQSCQSLYELAIASLRKGCELWPGSSPIALLGEAFARAGYRDEAHKVLQRLDQLSKQRYVTPYGVSRIYVALGQKQEALQWLETAYQQGAEWMILLKVDPGFDELRSDPRFQDLMRRMNFPP